MVATFVAIFAQKCLFSSSSFKLAVHGKDFCALQRYEDMKHFSQHIWIAFSCYLFLKLRLVLINSFWIDRILFSYCWISNLLMILAIWLSLIVPKYLHVTVLLLLVKNRRFYR